MRETASLLAASLLLAAGCAPESDAAADAAPAAGLDLSAYEIVDLTHPFDENTVYWPTAPSSFRLDTLAYGQSEGGYFYSAMAFASPEHGGTHLDAPMHFAEGRDAADEIPLDRLMGSAVVVDISDRTRDERDYLLTPEDVRTWEAEHGAIEPGTIVLLRTGWDRFWPSARTYLGDDTPGDASNLHFPSYGPEAARLLVEDRQVAALGADVASIDGGQSSDFMVHRIAMEANVPGFENVAGLDRLPARGATVIALPMKIAGGSGGPLRIVALVPR